jgi:hypothetical protein
MRTAKLLPLEGCTRPESKNGEFGESELTLRAKHTNHGAIIFRDVEEVFSYGPTAKGLREL